MLARVYGEADFRPLTAHYARRYPVLEKYLAATTCSKNDNRVTSILGIKLAVKIIGAT